MAGQILTARVSTWVSFGGRNLRLVMGQTTAREGHPIVAANPGLWVPLKVTYDTEEPAAGPAARAAVKAAPAARKQGSAP